MLILFLPFHQNNLPKADMPMNFWVRLIALDAVFLCCSEVAYFVNITELIALIEIKHAYDASYYLIF